MSMIWQGVVMTIAGMGIVYLFLWVMIVVVRHFCRFIVRFDYLIPDDAPKSSRKNASKATRIDEPQVKALVGGTEIKSPVPGTILRLTAATGQSVRAGDEILVMDVMKMETPISAPCDGKAHINVAVMDKVSTGDVVAIIEEV